MNKIQSTHFSADPAVRYSQDCDASDQCRTKHSVSKPDRWVTRGLLKLIGSPPISFVLWNGEQINITPGKVVGKVRIHDRPALYCLLLDPEFNFGNLYAEGRISVVGDLPKLLDCIYRSIGAADKHTLARMLTQWPRNRRRNNDVNLSKENIHHHYNIGNEFYEKWLDKDHMQYTCAYYSDPLFTLEQAQVAKMDYVCRKLSLKPGQLVFEAGCGWGGLSRFMAKRYGVKVRAYNISSEQIIYAREMCQKESLQDRIEYVEDDYRSIAGDCDAFVSIGMLEHVGVENYQTLGSVIDRCLKDNGTGLIHSIGRNSPQQLNRWIENRIFPGACPPSISQMMTVFESQSLSVLDIENLRLHYAKTLQHWLQRFEQNIGVIKNDFDENFIRSWRLYLAGSIAGFTSGTMQLFQVLFSRPENNTLPNTRAHLYESDNRQSLNQL